MMNGTAAASEFDNLAFLLEPTWHARSAYHSIYEKAAHRSGWIELPYGWLLCPMLNGPVLVYRDSVLEQGLALEHALIEAGPPVICAHKRIRQNIPDAKRDYGMAVRRLKMLNRQRTELAIGYSDPHILDASWRPPRRALLLFEGITDI